MVVDELLFVLMLCGCDGCVFDLFWVGGWLLMWMFCDDDEVDFVIVGIGVGGGMFVCKFVEYGFLVVVFDVGVWWWLFEEFVLDEMY